MTQSHSKSVGILYGKGEVDLSLHHEDIEWDVIRPLEVAASPDPHAQFLEAVRSPTDCAPLRDLVAKGKSVCIVTSDGTRPVPNKQLIPWIVEEMGVADDQVTILIGTGSHRPNTDVEMLEMFGEDIISRFNIVNHDSFCEEENVHVGDWADGGRVLMDKCYVESDIKIVIGFIEPHFFAGFSGGSKGVVPGIAGIETILRLHRYQVIAHERNTWGIIDDNPTQDLVREAVSFCSPDIMINVSLNNQKKITNVFAGDVITGHIKGCEYVKEHAMIPVEKRYPLVITSVSGYPLDQNLYQAVKAVSVANRIVADGGTILLVSECSDGLPSHGNFGSLLTKGLSAAELLKWISELDESVLDQWQAQTLATVASRCNIALYSMLDAERAKNGYMQKVENIQEFVDQWVNENADQERAAVLPEGPLTIPFIEEPANISS